MRAQGNALGKSLTYNQQQALKGRDIMRDGVRRPLSSSNMQVFNRALVTYTARFFALECDSEIRPGGWSYRFAVGKRSVQIIPKLRFRTPEGLHPMLYV
jgi:hypothetical protein